jgi:uncharacterized protein YjbJ (UPF0337 family)
MDWKLIQSNWGQYKLNARMRWSRLSLDELDRIAGDREKLAGRISEVYGMSAEEAELQLAAWRAALREVDPLR